MKILFLLNLILLYKIGRKIIEMGAFANANKNNDSFIKNEYPNFENKKESPVSYSPNKSVILNKNNKVEVGNLDPNLYPEKIHPNFKGKYLNKNNLEDLIYKGNSPFYNGHKGEFSNLYNDINHSDKEFLGKIDIYNFYLVLTLINSIFNSFNTFYRIIPIKSNIISKSSRYISKPIFENKVNNLYLIVNSQRNKIKNIINLLIRLLEQNKPKTIEDIFEFYRINRKYRLAKLKMTYYKRTDYPNYGKLIFLESLNFKRELNEIIKLLQFFNNFIENFVEMVLIIKDQFPLSFQSNTNKIKLDKILNMIISLKQSKRLYLEKIYLIKSYYNIIKSKRKKYLNIFKKMNLKHDEYNCLICSKNIKIMKLCIFLFFFLIFK